MSSVLPIDLGTFLSIKFADFERDESLRFFGNLLFLQVCGVFS